jgi:hypothetical protein
VGTWVGISGHRRLSEHAERIIRAEIHAVLRQFDEPVVVSSLAAGADQIAAEIALDLGAALVVIVPALGYRESLEPLAARRFDELVERADEVQTLDFDAPGPEAYLAAGMAMLRRVSLLIAVWDGEAARGTGGTADVVALARERHLEVRVIWPRGETRA